jgi:hypothetical protein
MEEIEAIASINEACWRVAGSRRKADPIRFHQNDVSAYVTVITYCETSRRDFLKASEN